MKARQDVSVQKRNKLLHKQGVKKENTNVGSEFQKYSKLVIIQSGSYC